MHVDLYAVIASLVTSLFIVTKTRHPHIAEIRASLGDFTLFRAINALDFYTGNHHLLYKDPFQEPLHKHLVQNLFQCSGLPFCPYPSFPPYVFDTAETQSETPLRRLSVTFLLLLGSSCTLAAVALRNFTWKQLLVFGEPNMIISNSAVLEKSLEGRRNVAAVVPAERQYVPTPLMPVTVTQSHDIIFYTTADSITVAPLVPLMVLEPAGKILPLSSISPSPVVSQKILGEPGQNFVPSSSIVSDSAQDEPVDQEIQILPDWIIEPDTLFQEEEPAQLLRYNDDEGTMAASCLAELPFTQDGDSELSASPASSLDDRCPSPFSPLLSQRVPPTSPMVYGHQGQPPTEYWDHLVGEEISQKSSGYADTAPSHATRTEMATSESDFHGLPPQTPLTRKIAVARARATTAPAQLMTVTAQRITLWKPQYSRVNVNFVMGRTCADLVRAMSTSMPRVIDLGLKMVGGGQGGTRLNQTTLRTSTSQEPTWEEHGTPVTDRSITRRSDDASEKKADGTTLGAAQVLRRVATASGAASLRPRLQVEAGAQAESSRRSTS